MAVPKKRQGHARQAKRRANWKATVPAMSTCPNCGAPRHPHTMCGVCGFYKDRVVLKALQNDDFDAPVVAEPEAVEAEAVETEEEAPAPKKAKKTAKKKDAAADEKASEKAGVDEQQSDEEEKPEA
jgi:large subunit ribosomal protein L32